MRYRKQAQGGAGRPRSKVRLAASLLIIEVLMHLSRNSENAGPERSAGALAIAVASITVLRTAGDLTSDHKGRSNALIDPAVNVVVRKKRVR